MKHRLNSNIRQGDSLRTREGAEGRTYERREILPKACRELLSSRPTSPEN